MSWGADVLGVTEDTFRMIKSATAGIDTTTGIAGIDLLDDIMSWVPVDVPFFNSTPRGQGKGATAVFWQTLLNLNGQQPDGGTPANYASSVIDIQNQYTYSPYAKVGVGGKVTWDAIAQGEDYADVLAVDTLQVINQQLINLDIHQLNAQSFALPAIAEPTGVASATGGSIATGTVYIKVAARSGVNWYRGGSGVASTERSVSVTSSPSTGSVVASVADVIGAAGYDWYVGSSSGAEYYYTTTPINTVTITSIPTVAQNVPTGYAGLYGSYGPGSPIAGPSAVPTADTSYQTYWQNGLTASILGWWPSQPDQALASGAVANLVTPGTSDAVSQGAYYQSLDGGQLAVSGAALLQVDAMNLSIYNTYQVTPSRMLMGSQVITDIANAVLDNPQAVTWLVPTDKVGRGEMVAGGHVATYLNKTVNGRPIEMHLMPNLPPGKIVSVIDSLPFPGSNVTAALQVRTQYDFFRFDYGANRIANTADGGPRYDFEVASRQAFVNKAAGICGMISNIGSGVA
jgi:hypothetical protein